MARTAWREPTLALPLRWGTHGRRSLAGLALIVAGAIGLQAATPHILYFLLAGTVAHSAGWAIMPSRGWRRVAVAMPCVAVIWVLLTGPQSVWALAIPYLAWLLVRHRPLRSYVTVVFVIAAGVALPQFFAEYQDMLPALASMAVVLFASGWLARFIAQGGSVPSKFAAEIR